MEIRLLGPVSAVTDHGPLELGGRKQRSLLALLAIHAGEVVSVDRCIQALWGEQPPSGAVRSLQTYVSNLRRLLDPDRSGMIEMVGNGYRFTGREQVDAHRLEELVAGEAVATGEMAEALELWKGEPLGELGDEPWAQMAVANWRELRHRAELALIDARLAAGEAEELIPALEALIERDPLREPVWERYLTALYRAGRQADALRAFQRVRDILGEELGIEPGRDLVQLEERILLQDPSLGRPRTVPSNLPAPIAPVIGRAAELDSLAALLSDTRLLTITGPGGGGKTTVMMESARRFLPSSPDGAFVLELASLADGSLIPTQLIGVLGLSTPVTGSHLEGLCRQLADRSLLLGFDNCEHLVDDVRRVAVALLRALPGLRIVATSRRPLGVAGEVTWQLPPMSLPAPHAETPEEILGSDAGRLFVERLSAADPSFTLTPGSSQTVLRICRRLDGLPLALELAAARMRVFGLDQLESRLDDRFSLLVGGDPSEVPHHETLLATLQWSYELLDERARDTYRRLSVFPGEFPLDAAEAVGRSGDVGDHQVADSVDTLVLNSLVTRRLHDGRPRFRMLETIRQHARAVSTEQESRSAAAGMLGWVAQLVREGSRGIEGPDQGRWIGVFRTEMDTIRAALEWAVTNDPATGLVIATGLARFWWLHATETLDREDSTSYLEEGRGWLLRLLEADAAPRRARGRALVALGGLIDVRLGLFEDAAQRLEEARTLLEEEGDLRNLGWAWFYTGVVEWDLDDLSASVAAFQKSLGLHRDAEDRAGMGFSLLLLGFAVALSRSLEEGRDLISRFAEGAMRSGIPNAVAHAHDALALCDLVEGRSDSQVRDRIRESLRLFVDLGNHACLAHTLACAAVVHLLGGRESDCARAMGLVSTIRDRLSMVQAPYEDRTFLLERYGFEDLESPQRRRAFQEGQSLSVSEGIAWAVSSLG